MVSFGNPSSGQEDFFSLLALAPALDGDPLPISFDDLQAVIGTDGAALGHVSRAYRPVGKNLVRTWNIQTPIVMVNSQSSYSVEPRKA